MARTDTVISSKSDTITDKVKEIEIQKPSKKAQQRIGLSIDRAGWLDSTATITVTMYASLDNGKSWIRWCSLTDRGGGNLIRAALLVPPPPDSAQIKVEAFSNGKTVQQPIAFVEDIQDGTPDR